MFIRQGSAKVANHDKVLKQEEIVILSQNGSKLTLEPQGGGSASILVLSGEPLNEPIAARGPFVMNTQAELRQAMNDYEMGRMGL